MLILFGKHGQVAREVQQLADSRQIPLRVFSHQEADFLNPPQVLALLQDVPAGACLINAAAYTQVDQAESDVQSAEQINATTPGLIAAECRRRNLHLIHLSTDYVFSGEKSAPYVESDPTAPPNVYGQTKLNGERQILETWPEAIILRTSWVFSSHGKNFVTTMLRLGQSRKELSVVADQRGGPTSAAAIARTLLQLAERLSTAMPGSFPTGIFHYSGAPDTTWHHFAEEIFRQAGLEVQVHPISTSQYPTPAARPQNSILSCQRILQEYGIPQPDWRRDLADVLRELQPSP